MSAVAGSNGGVGDIAALDVMGTKRSVCVSFERAARCHCHHQNIPPHWAECDTAAAVSANAVREG